MSDDRGQAGSASQSGAWRRLAIPLLAVSAAVAFTIVATLRWDAWIGSRAVQTTDDAYVRAQITQLSSRVAGAVKTVAVDDFQRVKAGDLLIQIDPADYIAQVEQAEAAVAGAEAALDNLANQIDLQNATIEQAEAQSVSAQALEVEAQQEDQRQQALVRTEAGTVQKFQQAVAAYAKAKADVRAAIAVVAAQRQQMAVLAGTRQQLTATLHGAKATLDAAKLRLGYTRIVAPFDGVASERQVQPGDYVNTGSNLINVVPLPRVYVIANYKETQLRRVRPGQRVTIVADTFSGQTLKGEVERISPASGSQFALLPPDNATGNFTKVVQRIPVRIQFAPGQPLLERLLPGMSVTTRIHADDGPVGDHVDSAHR
ncbi:Secretion protein HlyD [Rhodopseudomonas palustris HaA2]|uniref:Secretion protein HlyD n=1 Tax=Rhodopseudomonas palustris (strain HaA2) TaxID=316058 RepID=Q2J3P2_RHOP2|nr:HlyD family secretion protein [Rhodopseudomonas palustris]ABD04918.1 Secretion protein HlyD [Rhodopseudomonas palustris HaA2]